MESKGQLNIRSAASRSESLASAFALTLCLLFLSIAALASDHSGQFTEEFHQTYPLSAGGRIELDNINGAVHITGWDRNEVKVDAVKYANSKERLDEAKIEVNASSESISIRTRYPDHDQTSTLEATIIPQALNTLSVCPGMPT